MTVGFLVLLVHPDVTFDLCRRKDRLRNHDHANAKFTDEVGRLGPFNNCVPPGTRSTKCEATSVGLKEKENAIRAPTNYTQTKQTAKTKQQKPRNHFIYTNVPV
jgi:hypothetical protein